MTSGPLWVLRVSKPAQKSVQRAPRPERERLVQALGDMQQNPFTGDVVHLTNQPSAFRRRVGDWRIFFDANPDTRIVDVTTIERRTTTTYRKR